VRCARLTANPDWTRRYQVSAGIHNIEVLIEKESLQARGNARFGPDGQAHQHGRIDGAMAASRCTGEDLMETLFVFARPPSPDEMRVVQTQPQAKILLLGPAVFTPATTLKNRTVLVMAEEVEELGAAVVLPPEYKQETSAAVIEALVSHKLFNL
jgi:hypothetical protein